MTSVCFVQDFAVTGNEDAGLVPRGRESHLGFEVSGPRYYGRERSLERLIGVDAHAGGKSLPGEGGEAVAFHLEDARLHGRDLHVVRLKSFFAGEDSVR